jgi:hypothetical protein
MNDLMNSVNRFVPARFFPVRCPNTLFNHFFLSAAAFFAMGVNALLQGQLVKNINKSSYHSGYFTIGPKSDEKTGEWRKLHNEEFHGMYSSPNIVRVIKSRRMRCSGHVARMREERGVYSVLVGKPEGKRPLGRPRRRWENNVRMDLQEVGCGVATGLCCLKIETGGGHL